MKRGVLLFAFNNGITDYYEMAVRTAKRVNRHLDLPVTVITSDNINFSNYSYNFDNCIIQTPNINNKKDKNIWINKNRYSGFELSPYDETIILDVDYLINSDTLLKPLSIYDDFMCHNTTNFILVDNVPEKVSNRFINTSWATVIYFKKNNKTKQIFECMEMIQNSYQHYIDIFDIQNTMYRNDYSLTIAQWIVNGNSINQSEYIPWNLLHLNNDVTANKISDTEFLFINNKTKKYVTLKDVDFHILNKQTFMEITNE